MQDFVRQQKNPPYHSKAELGAGASPIHCKVYKQTYWAGLKFDNKKAMTDNARHGEQQTPPSVSYLWAGAKKIRYHNDSGLGAGARPCWQITLILIETR